MKNITRRRATKLIGGAAAGLLLPIGSSRGESSQMLRRAIPSSGEKLPVIGLGTYSVFDVDLDAQKEKQLAEVLQSFVKLGSRVVDSSPMYGRAESVIGALASKVGLHDKVFLATKVWTRGKEAARSRWSARCRSCRQNASI